MYLPVIILLAFISLIHLPDFISQSLYYMYLFHLPDFISQSLYYWCKFLQIYQSVIVVSASIFLHFIKLLVSVLPNLSTIHCMHLVSFNCIDGLMVSVLALSAVDCGFKSWAGQTKDYNFGICCFSAKHAALRSKRTGWLGIMIMCPSTEVEWHYCLLLFQLANNINIQLREFV